MRRLLPALVCFALWCPVAASSAGGYFPNTPGTLWRYSSGEVQQTMPARTVRGVQVIPLSHSVGTQLVSVDYLEYKGGAVLLRGVQAGGRLNWYSPPLLVYPGTLAAGQRWSSASSGTAGLRLSGQVLGAQPLTTALGSFNTLVIRNDVQSGTDAKRVSTQFVYFVPGLGVVRYQAADGSTVDLLK
ncbi:hypothetical protein MF271_07410 [Deinococcus sp. KNUC1210]|uniref:hypothetical protein n=1 Tax=Deinococcus sp. KNUC1210 TaxID=2917691 RepID=UPI001EEFE537|nr:hypothetical protein [Deinococcus sp. KNUC1210]ULH16406.1 hypothetical protein MF271_07410 [Deinococcus sp. KNUC1210]